MANTWGTVMIIVNMDIPHNKPRSFVSEGDRAATTFAGSYHLAFLRIAMFRLLSLARRLPLDPHRGTFFMRGFSRGDAVSAGKDCPGLVEACTPCAGWQAHQIWDSMMIIQVAILPLHHRGLVVAAAAAVESKRHQATADHQPE